MTRIIGVFVLLFSVIFSFAQSFIGSVINEETNEPVPFATIRIVETDDGYIADAEGHFFIEGFPDRVVQMEVSSVGLETIRVLIDLSNTKQFEFRLTPSHFELKELVVSAPSGKLDEVSIVNVEHKSISSTPPSVSLAALLSSISGVEQISTGAGIGKPVIRGLSGSRIVVYSQNIRLENQQFGDEHGLGENAVGIERVEVIKGPASLLYGADAMGGVIYMVDEKYANRNESQGFIGSQFLSNAKTTSSQFGFKTNKEGLKWNAFGAYSSNIDYKLPKKRASNTRFDEMAIKTSLGYSKGAWVGNLRYSYLVNNFGIPEGEIGNDKSRKVLLPTQYVSQRNLSLENNVFFGQKDLTLIVGYSSNQREEFEESRAAAELDMLLNTVTYQVKLSIPSKSEKINMVTGIQGMKRKNTNNGERILIPDATTMDFGGYGLLTVDLNERLKLQGGLRYDVRDLKTVGYLVGSKNIPELSRKYSSTNFSMGGSYILKKLTFRTNVSTGYRSPNTAELLSNGLHEGTLRYELGSINLVEENATQIDASLTYENEHLSITINPFYNSIDNYIFLSPTGDLLEGADLYTYNQTNTKLWGGEIGLHYHPHTIHWLHIESNYSQVKAEDDSGNPLPLIPARVLTSKLSAELFSSREDRSGNVFVELISRGKQERVAFNESRSDAYELVNTGFDLERGKIHWRVGVDNLLNTAYVDHLSRLKADEIPNPGRNIYLGFNLSF